MIKLDEYGEVLNSPETYLDIATLLSKGANCFVGWTDEAGSHFDILFTALPVMIPTDNKKTIQGGLRPGSDLFVSIMRKGAFGFEINHTLTSAGYYADKLTLNDNGETADKLAELINGVKYQLYDLLHQ